MVSCFQTAKHITQTKSIRSPFKTPRVSETLGVCLTFAWIRVIRGYNSSDFFSTPPTNAFTKSSGTGKMMVEFFSTAISVSV